MMQDPMAERRAEQELRRTEIGAPDTSAQDRMIAELEKRKAQLEGPQDRFGRLMEYLGQVAQTPRGLSSFEAGAQGVAGLNRVKQARQLEQFDLSKQALEVSQKKLDTVRAFATEQYNVGKARFDQVYKDQFDAAKEIVKDEAAARKLAQENTLKLLEIESAERRTAASNATQLEAARIGAESRGGESKEVAAAEAAFARDPEAKATAKVLEMMALNPNTPQYKAALDKLQAIRASKYRQFGITLDEAPGAGSPGGHPPDVQALLTQYSGGK